MKSVLFLDANRNLEILEKWRHSIPRDNNYLNNISSANYIFTLKMLFGTKKLYCLMVMKLLRNERLYPILREGAIPQIFPNLPSYFQQEEKKSLLFLD
ncbi:hypothetical protein NQ315_017385 [Exocentrus adspersus]|uniref:Uncharacterized protein n=1 Tax=Exocentrus adspersus TaxID=1586481 RepID=A0AAV8VK06_9CUCU|nr:hypothetical protein NQ315_017385 [Exocentrus adspersus]